MEYHITIATGADVTCPLVAVVLFFSRMCKRIAAISVVLFSVLSLGAVSIRPEVSENRFDSIPMLNAYYDETLDDSELEFWDSCSVSLVTISKGEDLYSWFGHTGLLVQTPYQNDIFFDYGTFSFNADDFFLNFIFGRLWFCCYSSYADLELLLAEDEGRGVSRVVLPLDAGQKKAVISFLSTNVQKENRTYLYHHYNDNCATRIRDIVNRTTGGDFELWARSQPGLTFRQEASRALSQNRFVLWGLDFLQSGQIDQPATLWDHMFMPEILEKGIAAYYGLEPVTVLEMSDHYMENPEKPQDNILFSALLGLVLGAIALGLSFVGKEGHRGGAYCIYSGIVSILFAMAGSVLLFMSFFTNHNVTWYNENLLFVNPLLLVVSVLSFMACPTRRRMKKGVVDARRRLLGSCYFIFLSVIAVLIVLKLVLPGIFLQQNQDIILTMVIYYGCNLISNRKFLRKRT